MLYRHSSRRDFAWPHLVAVVALMLLLTACNEGKRLIKAAREQRAAGQATMAYETLDKVQLEAPEAPERLEASRLKATWLVEDADKVKSETRKKLLENALKSDPRSGQAQTRLCGMMAEEKSYEPLRECLNKGLKDKDEVPTDMAEKAKQVLASHDVEVREKEEKDRLLKSDKIEDWKTLQDKYPKSIEAFQASMKVREATSICGNQANWLTTEHLIRVTDTLTGYVIKLHESGNGDRTLPTLAQGQETHAKALEAQLDLIRKHPSLPGEEPVRKLFEEQHLLLVSAYRGWIKAIDQYEGSLAPFVPVKQATGRLVRLYEQRHEKIASICKNLPEPSPAEPTPATSSEVPSLSSSSTVQASSSTVRFKCPKGETPGTVRTGCMCGTAILNPCKVGGFHPTIDGDTCVFVCPNPPNRAPKKEGTMSKEEACLMKCAEETGGRFMGQCQMNCEGQLPSWTLSQESRHPAATTPH